MINLTVCKSNPKCYQTIQEALDAIRYNEKATITIKEGFYNEKIFCDKKDLIIKGDGNVVISFSHSAGDLLDNGLKRGTFRSYTALFSGERLTLENITIVNNSNRSDSPRQAISLYLDVTNAHLKSVHLRSTQDTLFLSPLPKKEREERGFFGPRTFSKRKHCKTLFEGGSIIGDVDFIFGSGDALFKGVEIISIGGGYVTAPSTDKDKTGFIFDSCTFKCENVKENSVYLMRPWRDYGKASFINCTFGSHIIKPGLSPWSGREKQLHKATFIVDNSTYLS